MSGTVKTEADATISVSSSPMRGARYACTAATPPALTDAGPAFAEPDEAPDYADQATAQLAEQAQPLLDDWLARIRQRLARAGDLQQLQDDLLSEFAELDETALAGVMALAFACADLAGRAEVQDGQ